MKPGPIAAAVLLAAFLVLRRRKLEPTLKIGGAIVVVGLLIYGSGLIQLPDFKKIVEDAGNKLGNWTYLVVGVMAFFETGAFVGLIAPGETFLIFGGVVAGQGTISLVLLIAITWACAVLGDLASYYAGRKLGRAFLIKHGPKVQITEERVHQVEAFFDRHGGKAIFLGRFVGLVRAVNPFLAGSSRMPMRRFLPYDVVGAGAWATMLLVLGYVFWQSFDQVLHYAEQGTLALGTTIVVLVALVWGYRHYRVEENRERTVAWIDAQLDRPALRPVAAVVRPVARWAKGPLRFFWNRITPGQLGLELTTLLAFAAVGSFAFLGNAIELDHKDLLTGDKTAFRWADKIRSDTLDHVAKVLTHLGSLTVVLIGLVATLAVLLTRRRINEAVTLAGGMLLTYVAVHVAKDVVDRPRPEGALVSTDGMSFPSGHAAYAFAWIAMAVVLTRTLPGLARTTAAIVVAVVVAVVVGLTRIYLRAHFLSDVVGGWGLAATTFSLCGMAGLVVAFLRHNGSRT
ncbi:MAG TPA: bifunctional DedA family/phosphatase PAP2 family protein [Baekduia sp.]|uniref:bifunctional DedA family/phosphatase PAP2 family protein n=1 Tax=Baekduia sp. TaxID=2600305 RepID=UPI002D78EA7C|nr:bifunctional DedA family/phosphatase PAP2 family protein [Baekduia sp.]HET6505265.1 bifunctional DedA family/phosphatase PAP2 family protein [Baekduia sp.]